MSDSARSERSELRRDLADARHPRQGGPDRPTAQRRANRIRAFRAELQILESGGVVKLSDEARTAIETYHQKLLSVFSAEHDVDRSDAAGQLSLGMRIVSFLAALALTAGIYSLVARFWGRFDLPLQATLLCAFPLVCLVAVELSAQRERSLYIASIFALAAFGTYWLAVFELSQLLNVPLTPPAVWGGALFGLALALAYQFRLILAGALGALVIALAGSSFQAAGLPWTQAIEYPELITAAALILAVLAPRLQPQDTTFAAVTRVVGFSIGFLGLLLLSTTGRMSLLPVGRTIAETIYQVVMLVAGAGTFTFALRKRWTETVYVTATALTLFIIVRFVDWFWDALPPYLFFFLLAALAFAWLFALRRVRQRLRMEAA